RAPSRPDGAGPGTAGTMAASVGWEHPADAKEDAVAITDLIQDVSALRSRLLEAESRHAAQLDAVRDRHRPSARNLVHYVALRSLDLRDLQDRLTSVGISSLGRMEAGVLGHLDTVLTALRAQLDDTPGDHPAGDPAVPDPDDAPDPDAVPAPEEALTPAVGRRVLARNTERLLGQEPPGRSPRIMVTMPSAAAEDPELVGEMIDAGMDLARVNCAHDDEDAWRAMIDAIRSRRTP